MTERPSSSQPFGDGSASTDAMLQRAFGRRNFLRASLGAAILPTAFLAACGKDSSTGAAAATGGAATTDGALVIATTRAVLGLDPAAASGAASLNTWLNLYDTLFDGSTPADVDAAKKVALEGVKVKPMLASSWESSNNEKTWQIKLQPTSKSPAGNELSADDVIYSMDRGISLQYTPTFFLGLIGITKASQFKAVDDKTVELTLPSAPPAFFLQVLGAPWITIYDSIEMKKHATSKDPWGSKWLDRHSAGYGPFEVGTISADGSNVVLNRTAGYWGDTKLKSITMRTLPESSSRAQLLLSGQAQLADDLPPAQLDQVAKGAKTKVETIATPGFVMLCFNNKNAPFNDVKFRQGLAQAIPYDDIVKSAYRGRADRWNTLLPPYFQASTTEYWKYDGGAAAAKTALAPYAGKKIELSYASSSDGQKATAILVQAALNTAGLSCSLNAMDQASYDTKRLGGELPFWIDDVNTPAVPNSFFAFQQLYVKKPIQPLFGYDNPKFDTIVELLGTEKDVTKQNDLIKQAQAILMEDLPAIPVAWTGFRVPAAKTVQGFTGHSLNILWPKELQLTAA